MFPIPICGGVAPTSAASSSGACPLARPASVRKPSSISWPSGPARSGRAATVDREAAEQVGEEGNFAAVVEHHALEDAHAELGAQRLEIDQRAVVHVGRVVPLIWKV